MPLAEGSGAEICVLLLALEHEVDRAQDGSGYRDNRLFGTATSPHAVIEGLEVGVFLAGGRPSGLNQRRAEPGVALTQTGRPSFAGTLVAAWTQSGPGDQVPSRREALGVEADLSQDDPCRRLLDARDRLEQLYLASKRVEGLSHAGIDLSDRQIQGVDLFEMKPQQESMMLKQPASKRIAQLLMGGANASTLELSQRLGIALASDKGLQNGTAGDS